MDWVPPLLVRRFLIAPIVVVLAIVALVLAVPVLFGALFVDLVTWRPLSTTRLALVALAHLGMEGLGVLCLAALWVVCLFVGGVRSSTGQELHHRFMHWWLRTLIGITGALVGIRVEIEDRRPPRPGPVLVFSRHAGPWDSFLLAHTLVHGYRRRPRVVMKEAMQWSPVIDLSGNRLPNRFIRPRGPDSSHFIMAIEDLAHGLGGHDALILFPEAATSPSGAGSPRSSGSPGKDTSSTPRKRGTSST